ncbi:MAG: sporulation membrane protein YtaF [Pelosinus sp.]|nr:sporulation membrane protein YtaF [Pelosinus sp.]
MTGWLVVLGFAVSSSVDNFGVGLSYGIRGIKVGMSANTIIAAICFIFSMVSTILGRRLALLLPGILPIVIGAVLLFFIGIRIVLITMPQQKPPKQTDPADLTNNKIDNILSHPEIADSDQSGEISLQEALLLGVALSVNALTNGLGAGLLDCTPVALSFTTAVGSYISLWAGALLGKKAANLHVGSFNLGEFSTLLSGVILILIALKTALF